MPLPTNRSGTQARAVQGRGSLHYAEKVLKVAVFVFGYPPSSRGGGPPVSVSRLCESETSHEVRVVTRDRDLGSRDSLGLPRRCWLIRKDSRVLFLKVGFRDFLWMVRELRVWRPDLYYINSVHGFWFAIIPLVLLRAHFLPKARILLAPRGELSRGSLRRHRYRKRLYRRIFKTLTASDVIFHASTKDETEDIRGWLRVGSKPLKVIERVPVPPLPNPTVGYAPSSDPPAVTFASRIHPNKGLLEAISVLKSINTPVSLVVFGPVEDLNYWELCRQSAYATGSLLQLHYRGEYVNAHSQILYRETDLAVLLSHGESFGHAIAEPLSVGCPVLISGATPWSDLVNGGCGYAGDVPLEQVSFLTDFLALGEKEKRAYRLQVLNNYTKWFRTQYATSSMFSEASNL